MKNLRSRPYRWLCSAAALWFLGSDAGGFRLADRGLDADAEADEWLLKRRWYNPDELDPRWLSDMVRGIVGVVLGVERGVFSAVVEEMLSAAVDEASFLFSCSDFNFKVIFLL